MSVTEAAKRAGLRPWTIRKYAREEAFYSHLPGGSRRLGLDIDEATFAAWMRLRKLKGANAPLRNAMMAGRVE